MKIIPTVDLDIHLHFIDDCTSADGIENGSLTTVTAHPYVVSLQGTDGTRACGGALIDSKTVVTADQENKACNALPGSPLVSNNQLVGLASWGYGCDNSANRAVFTNIVVVKSWIKKTPTPPPYNPLGSAACQAFSVKVGCEVLSQYFQL
ncbi:trypsin epsilon-like [Anastrepha ludens]|uniref:trypsin epsilon-like n=1 Tax=Anastrepha ludens TaxID=28586 RepID=UPI0023B11882|nr:trypsin epsilon-like [Anastrepha ludens]